MPRLPICPYCNREIQKNEASKKYNNKSYHLYCYQKYCDEVYRNSNVAGKDEYRQDLYDYICQLFHIKELTPFLNFQLQKLFKENKFTYNGVLYSLKYFYEVKENPVDIKYGIGIVPSIYEEARNFYLKKKFLREKHFNTKINKTTQTVRVSPHKNKAKPLVDITKL